MTFPAIRRSNLLFFVAVTVITAFGIGFAGWRSSEADKAFRQQQLDNAIEMALAVNPANVSKLAFTASDTARMEFKRIRQQMIAFSHMIGHAGIYSMALKDGRIVFGPETYSPGDPLSSAPGTVFEQPDPADFIIFKNGRPAVNGPVTDEYGTFITALAPVIDRVSGKVLMVVGIDVRAEEWEGKLRKAREFPLVFLGVTLLFLLAGHYLNLRRKKMNPRWQQRFRFLESNLSMIIGIFLTIASGVISYESETKKDDQLFRLHAQPYITKIRQEFNRIQQAMTFTRDFFMSSKYVDSLEFKTFVMPVLHDYDAVTFIWSPFVRHEDRSVFERSKKTGSDRILTYNSRHPDNPVAAPESRFYLPAEYIEPPGRTTIPRGFDLYSVPHFRPAISEACLTNKVRAPQADYLFSDKEDEKTIIGFLPVNKNAGTLQDSGFISVVVNPQKLLESIVRNSLEENPTVAVDLLSISADGKSTKIAAIGKDPNTTFFSGRPDAGNFNNMLVAPIFNFGRSFALNVHENSHFTSEHRSLSWIALPVIILLLTVFITLFIRFLQNRQVVLDQLVSEKTSELEAAKNIAEENSGKIRKLIDCAPLPIVLLGPSGTVNLINQYFTTVFGYTHDDIRSISDWWPRAYPDPAYRDLAIGRWSAAVMTAKSADSDILSKETYRVTCKDGSEKQVILAGTHISDELMVMFIDITDLERTREELMKAKGKAEESDRYKSTLLLTLSHEMRTPLTGILGFSDLLAKKLTDHDLQKMANDVVQSGARLMETFDSIFKLSKLETESVKPDYRPVDVGKLILEQVRNVRPRAAAKRVTVRENIQSEVYMMTDETMLRDVLFYLVDNAIKFTPSGYIWISLKMEPEDGKNKVEIRVRDSGPGIPEEKLGVIFQPFRQGSEGLSRSHVGAGLGLTICQRYLALLGGELQVESVVGAGSTFILLFRSEPVSPPETPGPDDRITTVEEILPVSPGWPIKILIVEDNQPNADLMVRYLGGEIQTDVVNTGTLALKYAYQNVYDLVLMDINLGPDMDGIRATREIRKFAVYESVPILAITGYSTEQERQYILEQGLNGLISKPFTRQDLLQTISAYFDVHEKSAE